MRIIKKALLIITGLLLIGLGLYFADHKITKYYIDKYNINYNSINK